LSANNNLRLFIKLFGAYRGREHIAPHATRKKLLMTVVSTLDVHGLTACEYRAVMDELGVETRPEGGIYLHLTTPTSFGFRVVEIWNEKEGFDRFVEQRLTPAGEAVGLEREMTIAVTPLHNFFAPRLSELPTLVASLPGAPNASPSSRADR
jgi:hypothetical protein